MNNAEITERCVLLKHSRIVIARAVEIYNPLVAYGKYGARSNRRKKIIEPGHGDWQ